MSRLQSGFDELSSDPVDRSNPCMNAFERDPLEVLDGQYEGLLAISAGIVQCLHHRHGRRSAMNHLRQLLL